MTTTMRRPLARTLGAALLFVAAFAFTSCYPDYGLTVTDYDAVSTYHKPDATFGGYATFFLIDTVQHPLPPGTDDDITRIYDQTILTSVAANMTAAGYVQTTNRLTADLVLQVSMTRQDYMVYYGWGGYWGWGCCYYWPPYYPPVYGYSYTTGTIVVDMVDRIASDDAGQPVSIWMSILSGLAGQTTSTQTDSRIRNGINQAFQQSPYLSAD